MRPLRLPFLFALILCGCAGDATLYEQSFENDAVLAQFEFTDADAWRWSDAGGVTSLELFQQSEYAPPVRSPHNIALLPMTVGDFVLEVDCQQTGREYGHRDLCLFFGYQDPSHYYYTHLATTPDQNAHNIFLVDGAPRRNLADVAKEGVDWGQEVWHTVRLERAGDSIRVWFDGRLVREARDSTFPTGRLGLGSFDDTGRFARLRIEVK